MTSRQSLAGLPMKSSATPAWSARLRRVCGFPIRLASHVLLKVFMVGAHLMRDMDRVNLHAALDSVRRLDYPRQRVLMHVRSRWELARLRSASKEPWTIAWIESYIRPEDVLYDIGANVGAYALVAMRHTNGQGHVYAFEPGFETFASLCRNVVLNGCQHCITPLPVALGARTGRATFKYRDVGGGAALHAMGDRLPGKPGESCQAKPAYEQTVLAYRLDDLVAWFDLAPPNHIKLDVDGAELEVLRGAAGVLADARLRTVMLEMNEEEDPRGEVVEFLEARGLRLISRAQQAGRPAYGLFARSAVPIMEASSKTLLTPLTR
jgi:FkbM family methyltransferase